MTDDKKIFALMAHAEDLQKLAIQAQKDFSQRALESTQAVRDEASKLDAVIESIPNHAEKAILGAFEAGVSKPLQKAQEALESSLERSSGVAKSLWIFPSIFVVAVALVTAGFAYFGISWLKSERAELKAEIARLKYEYDELDTTLAKIPRVEKYSNGEVWVQIANSNNVGTKQEGKITTHWARLPSR